ncbi:hypothetical protein [Mycobacterium arosiense]|uniref:Uncharacterized protein n=1 Tax=Mycobacterium arosiense ATCC BAA-1401 = DSM 45069 TaxID=1265311 RepID=A0A1W9ZKH2_MYCAI|nr:hypothetical protein [Mycobacterium arosiense]ORA17364.1 hypothetical protein BST14_08815 [Mycobacterium arosiense ATCC BAA-1401 = DSM 45069]
MSETEPISTETPEPAEVEVTAPESEETPQAEADTFSREYVTELRNETKEHRVKAEGFAARLHTELVRATGRLADPTELPFRAEHLDDPDALKAAIDELLTRKPHYAARTPQGNIGQGVKDQGKGPLNLVSHLKTLV